MDSLLNRYALALFSIALDENKVEEYQKEAKAVYKSVVENNGLVHLLSSYFLTQEEKGQIIDEIYQGLELGELKNFLKVIVKNGRGDILEKILKEFNKICNEYRGIASGIVYTADELSETQIEAIEKSLSEKEGIDVELQSEIDKSLLGGVKVVIGDRIFDSSLKSGLESMKSSLLQGGK